MKRSRLKRDPAKVRAWVEKSRAKGSLARVKPLASGKRKRRRSIPPDARLRALGRTGGWCVMCLFREGLNPNAPPPQEAVERLRSVRLLQGTHIHHVLPVQRWPELELEEDNFMPLCPPCHDLHERAVVRVPRAALPESSVKLARRVGEPAPYYIERTYPA